jgi:hypothetical protein
LKQLNYQSPLNNNIDKLSLSYINSHYTFNKRSKKGLATKKYY